MLESTTYSQAEFAIVLSNVFHSIQTEIISVYGFRQYHNWTLFLYLFSLNRTEEFNLLKPTGYVMHHQFNIQQLYALPTLYLCVLYLSANKQRLVPLTA